MSKTKDLELRLQRTEQQLRLFQKISRFMVRDMSLQEVLQGIVALVVEFTECDSCLVYLRQNGEMVLCASNTPHPSTIGKLRMKVSEGLTGWVARERRLLAISREAYKDVRFKGFGELPEDTFEAFLSAPVIARNEVVGVINVQHRLPHQHTGYEMEVLTTVGEQVGCVLELARMEPKAIDAANHAELVLAAGPREADQALEFVMIRTLLLLVALASAQAAPRWELSYFYDKDRSTLNIVDLCFPSAERGVAAGSITEHEREPARSGRRDQRWRPHLVPGTPQRNPALALFP